MHNLDYSNLGAIQTGSYSCSRSQAKIKVQGKSSMEVEITTGRQQEGEETETFSSRPRLYCIALHVQTCVVVSLYYMHVWARRWFDESQPCTSTGRRKQERG